MDLNDASIILPVVIVLLCALGIYFLGRKIKMPLLIGYFLTGIIVGPYALGWVNSEQVSLLSELGVIFLMFTIGLEVSLKTLLSMKKIVLIAGTLQLVLTCGASMGLMMLFGYAWNVALFIGFLVAHSSTAIIMNIYQKSGEVDKEHGKVALGILIFQDLNVVPMMMLVPLLAGTGGDIVSSIIDFVIGMVILVVILLASVFIVPKILKRVALTRSREIFFICVIIIFFGIAWLMSMNNVSLALGAFLAGVAISGTEFNHDIMGQISPIRDVLSAFFFVSVGMMLNLGNLAANILLILGISAAVLVAKTAINIVSVKAIGIGTAAAILSAIGLSQIGEFSFILGKEGLNVGILTPDLYQAFLAITIITMAVTPVLCSVAPKMTARILKNTAHPMPQCACDINPVPKKEHVIIAGYGLMGRSVARALQYLNIDYLILEMNSRTVEAEKKNCVPIYYGDVGHESVLEFADIEHASAIILTIPDIQKTKAVITLVRRMNPSIDIIVRTRYISEIGDLYRLGADDVIVDERESGVQIFRRLMANYNVSRDKVAEYEKELKSDLFNRYLKEKGSASGSFKFQNAFLESKGFTASTSSVEHIRIEKNSFADGKSLSELELRSKYDIAVLALKRHGEKESIVSPDVSTILEPGDILVVIGDKKSISSALSVFCTQNE